MSAPTTSLIDNVILGRYQILRKLGSGGMGTVYKARQLSMDRMVALKLIHPGLADDPEIAARFHREMQASSVIEHPNTVRVFDFGETEERQLFLVMEFLEGRSLAEELQAQGPLPLPRIAYIGGQVARALGAAHQEGVVHRDLKPENVMLLDRYGERDFVKVLDFGIARFLDASKPSSQVTVEGSVLGTPAYMSPEQAMGKAIGPASDLYSLGILLYQMATGALPFNGETLQEVLIKQATEPPRPPSEVAPGAVDPALEALIMELLAKEVQRRPGSAAAVTSTLGGLLEAAGGQSMLTPPPAVPTQVLPGTRKAPGATPPSSPGPGFGPKTAVLQPPPRPSGTPRAPSAGPSVNSAGTPPPHATEKPRLENPSPRWVVPAVVAALVVVLGGASLAALQLGRSRKEGAAAAAAARARLDTLLGADGDPLPPSGCQVQDMARLSALLRPAELLAGAAAGSARPRDTEALTLLDKAVGPKLDGATEYWTLLARARLAVQHEPLAALEAASAAARLCPGYAVPHYLAGTMAQRGHRLDEARASYQRASAASVGYLPPRVGLGILALQAKDYASAEASFGEVLERKPDDHRARLGRGQARLLKGDVKGALLDLQDVTSRQRDRPEGWLLLGHALAKAGQWAEALSAFCHAKALGSPEAEKYCTGQ
jgi:serine/threonine protein kinase/tetratricopeptide (TPR) repeat protein